MEEPVVYAVLPTLVVYLILLAASVALSYLASLLIKPKGTKSKALGQDTPTTLATRGAYIPYCIGTRKVGSVFAWAGNRVVRQETISEAGGKGGGGGGTQTQSVYFEDAWHLLGTGPVYGLAAIHSNGKFIWTAHEDHILSIKNVGAPDDDGFRVSIDNGNNWINIYAPLVDWRTVHYAAQNAYSTSFVQVGTPVHGGILYANGEIYIVFRYGSIVFDEANFVYEEFTRPAPNLPVEIAPLPHDNRIISVNQIGSIDPINKDTSPSGTDLEIPGEGTLTIYWGELDQPIDPVLSAGIQVQSKWPYLCYAVWKNKRMGPTPVWPEIEYILQSRIEDLESSTYVLAGSNPTSDDGGSKGINAAHYFNMLLKAKYPHGLGIPSSLIDSASLQTLGTELETEHLPINLLTKEKSLDTLTTIIQDLGVMVNEESGFLAFSLMREATGPIAVLDVSMLSVEETENIMDRGIRKPNKVIYIIDYELDYKYRELDIKSDFDSDDISLFTKETIESVTHPEVGQRIANRRSQEVKVLGGLVIKGSKSLRSINPGDLFKIPDIGVFRVLNKSINTDSFLVQIESVLDSYSVPLDTNTQQLVQQPNFFPPIADESFTFIVNDPADPVFGIYVFRLRAHNQIVSADVYISLADNSYFPAGNQTHAIGAKLTQTISDVAISPIPSVEIEAIDEDTNLVLDLSSDTNEWSNGKQWCLINGELFYLKKVTALGVSGWTASTVYSAGDEVLSNPTTGKRYVATNDGTSGGSEPTWNSNYNGITQDNDIVWQAKYFKYNMEDLIRAKVGTSQENHAIGDYVYIIPSNNVTLITDEIIMTGTTLYVKTLPKNNLGIVSLGEVDAVSKSI